MNTNLHSHNNEDLRHIAPKLAAIPKLSIEESFYLPVGYFEKMPEEVMNHPFVKVKADFIAPDLYFDALPDVIAHHALIDKHNPFAVPENYFENVALHIEQKVEIGRAHV